MTDSSLRGRCALVTGSSGGLGYAMAADLATRGCHVVLNGLEDPATVEDRRADLERRSEAVVIYHQADLRDPEAIAGMMAAAAAAFGAIDILINNAVVRHFAAIDVFPVERWDEALAVNLSAAFHTIRLAVPAMRERGFGRIINLSSVYGLRAAPGRVDYVTTKTALIGLTRAVAMDVIGHGITCNAICPATIETPDIARRIDRLVESEALERPEAIRRYLAERKQPAGRFIEATNVAALVTFLCGPAGADITGATLPVDGG
jgi:3-hydroxybutyrate dehydrogenase